MKKLTIIINAVLIAAVAVLFILHFLTPKTSKKEIAAQDANASGISLAYVNIDSIFANYTLATELNTELTQKGSSMQSRLEKQMADFEKDYKTFIDKAQKGIFLTQQRQEEAQQELMVKQREIQKLEMEYSDELAREQQKMNSRIFDSINSYINTYNTPEKFQVIMGLAQGGNILYGSEQIDITETILEGLNKNYNKE